MSASHPQEAYRIALRQDGSGGLNDVVVQSVSMFRAERMDRKTWWLACYLPDANGDDGDRIAFTVTAKRGGIEVHVSETPAQDVTYESQPATDTDGHVAPAGSDPRG